MTITEIIEKFDPDSPEINDRVSALIHDKNIKGYLDRLPKGNLSQVEFAYVLDHYAELYMINETIASSKIRLAHDLKERLDRIEDAFGITTYLDKLKTDMNSTIMDIGGDQNDAYRAFLLRMDNYFGEGSYKGLALGLLELYAVDTLNVYHKFKRDPKNTDLKNSYLYDCQKVLFDQYKRIHEAINMLPALINREFEKLEK